MASNINPNKPTDVNALVKDIRDNFSAAKTEVEALQNLGLKTAQVNAGATGVIGTNSSGKVIGIYGENLSDPSIPATMLPASVRGIGNRSGFPNSTISGQLLSKTVITAMEDSDSFGFLFVAVVQFNETASTGGTIQGVVEFPAESGNWYNLTFNSATSTTLTSADFSITQSDLIQVPIKKGQEVNLYLSSINGVPTMLNGDWMSEQIQNREFQLQLNGTDQSAIQVQNINKVQLKAANMNPRTYFSSGATWTSANGGTLTIALSNHNQTGNTNIKALVENFVPSSINGLLSHNLSPGTNAIAITGIADPGTVTQNGTVKFVSVPTAVSWSGGVLTVTRSNTYVPGTVICMRGFTATGGSINRDLEIDTADANAFTFKLGFDPGTITISSGYFYPKYFDVSFTNFHLRPLAMVGNGIKECKALLGDSTTQSVDIISDGSRRCGVLQKLVGPKYAFIDLSANNEGVKNWITDNPAQHTVRQEVARRYCQSGIYGFSKNDETWFLPSTVDTWKSNHDSFWALPAFSGLAATGRNQAVLVPTKLTVSGLSTDFTTIEGQLANVNYGALPLFHGYLKSKLGTLYNHVFDYNAELTKFQQPALYKVDPAARDLIVTTTSGSPVVTVDSTTPVFPSDNGRIIGFLGASGSGNTMIYAIIKYKSPTSFIAMNPGQKNRPRTSNGTALTNGVGKVGARYLIAYDSSQGDTIHENPFAISLGTAAISFK